MSASADISKFLKGTREASEIAMRAAVQATDQFGEVVIGVAQNLTPVDKDDLQASGTTEPAQVSGGKITKVIGFNTDYAAAVHERLDVHHEIGQAKYLEAAVRKNDEKFPPYVAGKVAEALG